MGSWPEVPVYQLPGVLRKILERCAYRAAVNASAAQECLGSTRQLLLKNIADNFTSAHFCTSLYLDIYLKTYSASPSHPSWYPGSSRCHRSNPRSRTWRPRTSVQHAWNESANAAETVFTSFYAPVSCSRLSLHRVSGQGGLFRASTGYAWLTFRPQ